MVKFLKKFRNHGIKIVRVNSFLSPNLSIYSYLLEFCTVLGVHCEVDVFKLTASAQSINREVMIDINILINVNKFYKSFQKADQCAMCSWSTIISEMHYELIISHVREKITHFKNKKYCPFS